MEHKWVTKLFYAITDKIYCCHLITLNFQFLRVFFKVYDHTYWDIKKIVFIVLNWTYKAIIERRAEFWNSLCHKMCDFRVKAFIETKSFSELVGIIIH